MLVTCAQMLDAEHRVIEGGVSAADLMEEAGRGIAAVVRQFFPRPGVLIIALGKGNNAGDVLVAARELIAEGWEVRARLASAEKDFKPLPATHWKALAGKVRVVEHIEDVVTAGRALVVLDGLLGIGASGPLQEPLLRVAAEMNRCRLHSGAFTIAMDIPSGLEADSGIAQEGAVIADMTITIGGVKRGLLAESALNQVGRLALVPLRALSFAESDDSAEALFATTLRARLPRRPFDFHKGQAGRVGLMAGSRGFLGAAALAATGAVRGGAGLVTLLVREDTYAQIISRVPPEVMVRPVADYREALQMGFDVLAIGPGLGLGAQAEIIKLLRDARLPVVIDADAITMVANGKLEPLAGSPGPRLLTPHPGEMARMIEREQAWKSLDRRTLAETFVARFPNATLLLKGARTLIATQGQKTAVNTTGHPGMATGGIGDVLTGLCAALIAQGVSLHDTACLGSWLSGRAAEIAITHDGHSQESLAASDVAAALGRAFTELRLGAW